PGPGEYNIDRANTNNNSNKNRAGSMTPTSSFLCARTPLDVGTHLQTPAPGTYELLRAQQAHVDKSGNVLKDPCFRSQTKRNASFIATSDVPGPGEYDVSSSENKCVTLPTTTAISTSSYHLPQRPRFVCHHVGPGWYTPHQTKPSEKLSSSSSMFRSATKRFAGMGVAGAPGPAFYQPEPLGKKSFRWNANRQWV
ncbi:unnamed protein product, partial [Pylaiella littoralis]